MMRQRFTQICFANYFTILISFGLFLPPSVLEAQKLSTTVLTGKDNHLDPVAYFAEASRANKRGIAVFFDKDADDNANALSKEALPVVCYTITTPSAAQTVCVDVAGTNITVKTNTNIANAIRFVRFSTDQMAGTTPTVAEANALASYAPGYTDLAYVTATGVSPYTATYTWSVADFPNTTSSTITYYVYAVFNNGVSTCTPNPAQEIIITVKPKPTVTAPLNQYLCAGSASSAVTLTGSGVPSTTYAWTNSTTSVGLAASGSTTIPSFTAVNATASPVTATITATPTASTCVGTPVTSKIIVYPASSTMISGVAFTDFNENGVRDVGEGVQAGIVAKVYNCSGTLAGTSTTDANGFWSVSGLTFGGATDKYRVEFSIPTALSTAGLQPSANGTDNKTDIQFVSAASCNINFGVNNPGSYCQSNPVLATPCYTNGSRASSPNDAAVVLFNYNDRGQGAAHESVATISEVGAVWGEAYNGTTKKLYVSAFVKRHVDLSPNGLGAIYEIDLTTPTTAGAGTPTLWLDINAATFVNTSNMAVNLAFPADPGTTTRNLTTKTTPSRDNWAFDYVGKQGIGDIEMSEDGQRLYVMDLTNRQVLCINYSTKKLMWKLAVSTPACAGGSGDIRPWALKEHNGVLYVGSVCSGETNNNGSQLHYYVMQCNSLTAATSMSLAVDMGSTTLKTDGNNWQFWAANATEANIATTANNGYMNYPEPLISDIEFDKDENMIIGVMDRFGHQTGTANYIPNVTNTNVAYGIANGDITRAIKSGSTFTNETAPWGFFYLTAYIPAPPEDQFVGGMVVSSASGTNYVTANMIDPFSYNSSGVTWLKTSDGQQQGGTVATGRLEIVPLNNDPTFFGKANGLGDLTTLCTTAPIQIGNYVWIDTDKDGTQDPCEGPLSNVTVKLYKMDGTTSLIATTTTDGSGNYNFKDYNEFGTGYDTLTPGKMYFVVIEDASFNKTTGRLTNGGNNYQLSTQNATASNGNDQNDSDAFIAASGKTFDGYPVDTLTIPVLGAGYVNHTLDFGFSPTCDTTLTVSSTAICNGSSVNLFAQASGVKGTLTYSTNGTTWTALTNPTNVTPSVSTTYFIKDTLTSGCFDIDTLMITVVQPITAGVGTNPTTATCQAGSGLSNINLAGQITGATSGGTWSQTVGTAVGTALNTTTGVFNPNGIAVGTYTFRYTVTGTAPCPNDTEDITITIQNCCPPSICVPITVTRN